MMMTSELIRMELPAMISLIFSTLDNMFKWRIYLNPSEDLTAGMAVVANQMMSSCRRVNNLKKSVNASHTFCPQTQTNTEAFLC